MTATRFVLIALAFAVLSARGAAAGGVNCPVWADGKRECWAPLVTYRENVALLDGDTPVYVTRIALLVENEETFDTRAELQAYIQSVIIVRGFWLAHPTRCDGDGFRCLLVPPSAIDHVELRQIIDRPH